MSDSPIEAVTVAPCAICGKDIPMRVSEYKEMVRLGAPVIHREHIETETAPALKSYRAVVQVYEDDEENATSELVAATTATAHAPTFHAAFAGPLSEDLQRKWLTMGEKSSIADLPG